MRAVVTVLLALVTTACNRASTIEATNVSDTDTADPAATTRNAITTVDAATSRALGAAQARMDSLGNKAAPTLDDAKDQASAAVDKAKHRTGRALEKAGAALDQ